MKLQEAYKTLDIPEGSTPEEAKKAFKKKAAKYHPDVNKSEDAEKQFKHINNAYQCIQNGKGDDPPNNTGFHPNAYSGNPFNGSFNPFGRQYQQKVVQLESVELSLTIEFKEAVLGCKKEVKYSREAKCPTCDGNGSIHLNNGCTKCGGKGRIEQKNGGMIFVSTCTQCIGKQKTEDCKDCHGEGTLFTDVSIHISVPAGILDGNVLRLQGMGNYAGTMMGFMDHYTDALCYIEVIPDQDLFIEGEAVVSTINISLLDALQGCSRSVRTIFGMKEINIPAQSKHHEEVIIPKCGVAGRGNQQVLLNVQYPKNTDKLTTFLQSLNEEDTNGCSDTL